MSRYKPILLLVLLTGQALAKPQAQPNRPALADPLGKQQVVLKDASTEMWVGADPDDAATSDCKLKKGARGSVVASKGDKKLVVFNAKDWGQSCGQKKGLQDLPLVWVADESLKSVQSLSLDEYGDTCAAYEYLEQRWPDEISTPEGQVLACTGADCQTSAIAEAAKQMIDMGSFHSGNRCLIETTRDKQSADCSFATMLKQAQECTDANGKARRCTQNECEKSLRTQACQSSPWKNKGLDERFQLIMQYAKTYAAKYGVEPRAIPCIATVETGYLEPQAKTLLACGDADRNRYHGLGMITLQTLEHYVSPFIKRKLQVKENGKFVTKMLTPFRSANPLLQKPSLYACPRKLHDLLGSSPELQVELMAYTLAEKGAAVGGNSYQAYVNYNGHSPPDPENGRPHMNNYADAVQACVSCLRKRLPDENAKPTKKTAKPANPVECLSTATRGGTKHHFFLQPGDRIYKVFAGHYKQSCTEEPK
ncbi:MAG: hypothetical protein AB7N80_09890 [Bdellovibrionales bacterium]